MQLPNGGGEFVRRYGTIGRVVLLDNAAVCVIVPAQIHPPSEQTVHADHLNGAAAGGL